MCSEKVLKFGLRALVRLIRDKSPLMKSSRKWVGLGFYVRWVKKIKRLKITGFGKVTKIKSLFQKSFKKFDT